MRRRNAEIGACFQVIAASANAGLIPDSSRPLPDWDEVSF